MLLALSEGTTATITATATLAGVVIGGWLTSQGQSRRQRTAAIATAATRYQDEYSGIFAGLTKANREGRATSGEAVIPFGSYNQAMNGLLMVAPKDVAEAVVELDGAIGDVHRLVKRGGAADDEFRAALDDTDQAQLRFINAVRRAVGVSREPLTRFYGRNQRVRTTADGTGHPAN